MTRQQHGYLNGIPVTGQVEKVQVAGQVTFKGKVQLVHDHHREMLQASQEWVYTGTCRDVDGGFLYISETVRISILNDVPIPSENPGGWILERCG